METIGRNPPQRQAPGSSQISTRALMGLDRLKPATKAIRLTYLEIEGKLTREEPLPPQVRVAAVATTHEPPAENSMIRGNANQDTIEHTNSMAAKQISRSNR
jgi:hypothetical protein